MFRKVACLSFRCPGGGGLGEAVGGNWGELGGRIRVVVGGRECSCNMVYAIGCFLY